MTTNYTPEQLEIMENDPVLNLIIKYQDEWLHNPNNVMDEGIWQSLENIYWLYVEKHVEKIK